MMGSLATAESLDTSIGTCMSLIKWESLSSLKLISIQPMYGIGVLLAARTVSVCSSKSSEMSLINVWGRCHCRRESFTMLDQAPMSHSTLTGWLSMKQLTIHRFPTSPTSYDWSLMGRYWTIFAASDVCAAVTGGVVELTDACLSWDAPSWTTGGPAPAVLARFPTRVSVHLVKHPVPHLQHVGLMTPFLQKLLSSLSFCTFHHTDPS